MRLLLITQDFPPAVGGIETYAARLAERFATRCEYLAVLAPHRAKASAADDALPYPVHRLPARADLLVAPALGALPVLARRHRIDVAFHTQWQTVPAALLSRRLTGYPRHIAAAAHGRELLFNPFTAAAPRRLYDRLRRTALQGPDCLFPVSHYTAGLLHDLGVPEDKTTVVSNGTDPDRMRPWASPELPRQLGVEDRPVLLTLGRLVPRKGVDTVLRALPAVIEKVPDVCYVVVGDGPDRRRLEELAGDLGVSGCVRFVGRIPHEEVVHYYSACDVFVMPSREAVPDVEGFGIVFLEAGACGRPVVGARTGGIPDAVRHEETGLLVPPADAEKLAGALLRLLRNPGYAQQMGRLGRSRVLSEATWRHVADRLLNSLERCRSDR